MNWIMANGILGYLIGFGCFLLAHFFGAVWYAGQQLTAQHERSDLGRLLGRAALSLSWLFLCLGSLSLIRWYDFSPDTDLIEIAGILRFTAVGIIAYMAWLGFRGGPMILDRIEAGRIDTLVGAHPTERRDGA